MNAKALSAEMTLARQRDELIRKDLVTKQAAYLLVALRQNILNLPTTYARRMVGLKDATAAKKILQEMAICVLNEIKHFPSKAVNPNWLEELEDDQS